MQEPNIENSLQPITARTFGLELEFADVEKAKVYLPDGYSWSKEEKITNTDKSNGTYSAKRGGEINTPPLRLCGSNIRTLRKVFESALAADGKVTWVSSIHVHIHIADLELEDMLTNSFEAAASEIKPVVSVVEISDVQNRVDIIENLDNY